MDHLVHDTNRLLGKMQPSHLLRPRVSALLLLEAADEVLLPADVGHDLLEPLHLRLRVVDPGEHVSHQAAGEGAYTYQIGLNSEVVL